MSFSKNLKKLRIENNLSQEGLAEILDVSRQSISKYEQGNVYPEIDKLMILSQKFNVSIDSLLGNEENIESTTDQKNDQPITYSPDRKIMIRNYKGTTMGSYYKFKISPVLFPSKNDPFCVLSGIDKHTFWGEHSDMLAWYASEEDVKKEISTIQEAIRKGEDTYALKYYAKVKESFTNIKLDQS